MMVEEVVRKGSYKTKTWSIGRPSAAEVERIHQLARQPMHWRPTRRTQCESFGTDGRVCPYVSCAYHLYLDVTPTGSIKLNFPNLEVWELKHWCALDVAEEGGWTLEEVGAVLNITRERIRQIELKTLELLRAEAWWLRENVK